MIKGICGIIGMLFIWLCLNTSNIALNSSDIEANNSEVREIVKKLSNKAKRKINASANFHQKYFKQVFFQKRRVHGAGHTFTWNGKEYTTDYKEEK